jgi:thiol-disulfide isomerase/thioredoxin
MRTAWRWLLVALVVTVAVGVAAWPRPGLDDVSVSAPHRGQAPVDTDPVAREELAALVARAALAPCPASTPVPAAAPPPPPQKGPLAGVLAPCLGTTSTVDVGTALAGQPTLINLWASWCAPCREEIPVLARYASEPGSIRVVGINVQDSPTSALSLLADLGVHYPSYGDADVVAQALRAPPVLPLSYLVAADGGVRRITSTMVFHDVAQIRQAVSALPR